MGRRDMKNINPNTPMNLMIHQARYLSRQEIYNLAMDATEKFHFYCIFPRFPIESSMKNQGELWLVRNITSTSVGDSTYSFGLERDLPQIYRFIDGWIAANKRK